ADHFERGQIAVGNELLELAVPFRETPNVWVRLIVRAEIWIIESVLIQKLIGRRGLDDASRERIGDRVSRRGITAVGYSAGGVRHPAIVTNGSASVEHGIEDVSLLIACRAVGCGVVTVTG